jgi:hypothetical protein
LDGHRSSLHLSLPPPVKWGGRIANTLIFIVINGRPNEGKWAEKPLKVIWSHNTSISRTTNFTPFKLLFREEPVTSKEIKFQSLRKRPEDVYSLIEVESNDLLEPKE